MKSINVNFQIILWLFFAFISFIFLLVLYETPFDDYTTCVTATSIVGLIVFTYCIISWKRTTGSFFDLYTIFLSFVFLFNFGQCILWAFGIHSDNEIGLRPMYGFMSTTYEYIFKAQLLVIIGLISIHCGALFIQHNLHSNGVPAYILKKNVNLFNACLICFLVSFICMLFNSFRNIFITSNFGYGANLYDKDVISTQNNFVILLSWMFIPSIVGLLLSSNYSKWAMFTAYGSFIIYSILQTLGGDRVWIYSLFLLIWMHNYFYKKFKAKQVVVGSVGIFVVMILCVAISKVRSSGISLENIINSITDSNDNAIVSALIEMGGSMQPLIVLIQKGDVFYPYGNSYLLAVFGMISERFITLFIPDYNGITSWFSQSYLGIGYGAGFSIFAESYINFGFIGYTFPLFIIGLLSGKWFKIKQNDSSFNVFIKISACNSFLTMTRGALLTSLKFFFFSTLLIVFVYWCFCSVFDNNKVITHD